MTFLYCRSPRPHDQRAAGHYEELPLPGNLPNTGKIVENPLAIAIASSHFEPGEEYTTFQSHLEDTLSDESITKEDIDDEEEKKEDLTETQ